jgi:hypothetical protein
MCDECLKLLEELENDIEILHEGTDPRIQRLPGLTVHIIVKRMKKNLTKFNTLTLMNSKFLDGLL